MSVNNASAGAHRVSWEVANGRKANGVHVCHRCDTPSCVNPDHLWAGTNRDNISDRDGKGRAYRPSGSKNINARLTADDVRAIRAACAAGANRTHLAKHYGITFSNVMQIQSRRAWRHVI
jgi:hypothetical protein